MTMLQEDLDLTALWSQQVECEIKHIYTQCTESVVARVTYTCDEPANACAAAIRYVEEGIESDDLCDCDTPCRICWSVRPI